MRHQHRALITCSLIVGAALIAAGQASIRAQEATPAVAATDTVVVPLQDDKGQQVGMAAFTTADDGRVDLAVIAAGLTPGEHGIHVHETAACDPAGEKPFTSAGGHLNPAGALHGEHAGDLGNLTADADGDILLQTTSDRFALAVGEASLLDADGSALVIHATVDDLVTDPAGNSGARIVCGLIGATT